MGYKINKNYIHFNRPGTYLNATMGVIHSTENPNDSAIMERNYFNIGDRGSSAHAFIDHATIEQTIPWNEKAWHAGPTANISSWGIEMCHTSDPAKFLEIWNRATWLFAYLFSKVAMPRIFRINPSNLMSHAEVSAAWKEVDHQDPVSYFAMYGKSVDDFRAAVQEQIDKMLFEKAVTNSRIISSPEYWLQNCEKGKVINGNWVHIVILRFVHMFKFVNTFEEAVGVLKDMKIINSPDYWIASANEGKTVQGDYARILLTNMGKELI